MSTEIRFENGKLYVTRQYDAAPQDVFDAWIETSKIEKWWGCAQTTAVESEIEPKLGGKFNHMMTIEGAGQFPQQSCFTEFDPPNRLVYLTEATDMSPEMTVSVDFVPVQGGTRVTLVHEGIPGEFTEFVRGGWTAAFGKLDDLLRAGV